MKTKQFDRSIRINPRRRQRIAEGPNVKSTLLGVVCAFGVFGVLTLLYHIG